MKKKKQSVWYNDYIRTTDDDRFILSHFLRDFLFQHRLRYMVYFRTAQHTKSKIVKIFCEYKLFRLCRKYGIELVSLIAPTSKDRISMIASDAEGFVYIVSSLGVTGVRKEITTHIEEIVSSVREATDIPCAVGFGISTPEQAERMKSAADGVIIGSAIVRIVAEYGRDSVEPVREYVRSIARAVHN